MYAANDGRGSSATECTALDTDAFSRHAPGPVPRHIASTCAPVPDPLLDERELRALDSLAQRYRKLQYPGPLSRAARACSSLVPPIARRTIGGTFSMKAGARGQRLTDQGDRASRQSALTAAAAKQVGAAFSALEQQASELSASDSFILARLNAITNLQLCKLDEICLLRSYDVALAVRAYKRSDIQLAAFEGALTGLPGLPGIPFNIALATLLGFRAAQSVARFYGYDAKHDPAELALAGEVFMRSLDHSGNAPEHSSPIERVMLVGRGVAIKLGTKKLWAEAAGRGLVGAAIAQARMGAVRVAEESLFTVGVRETEQAVVRDALRLTGEHATQALAQKSIPLVSGAIGAYFDAVKVRRTLEYADIFYQKRFILEKARRIEELAQMDHGEVANGGAGREA